MPTYWPLPVSFPTSRHTLNSLMSIAIVILRLYHHSLVKTFTSLSIITPWSGLLMILIHSSVFSCDIATTRPTLHGMRHHPQALEASKLELDANSKIIKTSRLELDINSKTTKASRAELDAFLKALEALNQELER